MSTFHLQIVTPNGLIFDGQANEVTAPSIEGDVGILSGHITYVTPLKEGKASVIDEKGDTKTADCGRGILFVKKEITRLIADSFEWNNQGH